VGIVAWQDRRMRWDDLFRDLEAQLTAAAGAEVDAEVADRSRREAARLALVDRARAAAGRPLVLRVAGAGAVKGRLVDVGSEWLLLTDGAAGSDSESLVPLSAVLSISGLVAWTATPEAAGQVGARLGLGVVLRGIARDRSGLAVTLVDGSTVTGTLDRVGADFVEVSEHGPGEARRPDAVTGVRTVPFLALAVLRRGP
jgi:hypothetical protein